MQKLAENYYKVMLTLHTCLDLKLISSSLRMSHEFWLSSSDSLSIRLMQVSDRQSISSHEKTSLDTEKRVTKFNWSQVREFVGVKEMTKPTSGFSFFVFFLAC